MRYALFTLNQILGEHALGTEQTSVIFRQSESLWLDAERFENCLAACGRHGHAQSELCPACHQTLTEAIALYQDDFLAGFTLDDAPEFDDWQRYHAERLRRQLAAALEKLAQWHATQADYKAAITVARRWLALDALHEPAHRCLMRLYAWSGDQAGALRQYQECAQVLDTELGVTPATETLALLNLIKSESLPRPEDSRQIIHSSQGRPGTPTETTGLHPANRHQLPNPVTPLIGRTQELAAIGDLLQQGHTRLVTLTGTAGAGKTKLAQHAALNLANAFSGGAYFVNLVAVSEPQHVVASVAQVLGVQESAGSRSLLEQITGTIGDQPLLLVMDNFEHLLAAVPVMSSLLAACPHLCVLATSREALRLRGEQEFPVAPLPVPDSHHLPDLTTLASYASVQLFVQRARAVQPRFTMDGTNAKSIAEICVHLDGLPLAIELAAARVKFLPPSQLLQRLEHRFEILKQVHATLQRATKPYATPSTGAMNY